MLNNILGKVEHVYIQMNYENYINYPEKQNDIYRGNNINK